MATVRMTTEEGNLLHKNILKVKKTIHVSSHTHEHVAHAEHQKIHGIHLSLESLLSKKG